MGEPCVFMRGAAIHGYQPAKPDPCEDLIVCADSPFFPVDLPVAIKVASA
jgi:hypothetical protein